MKHKSLRSQIADTCIYFNGTMNKSCKAGMVYDEVDKGLRVAYRAGLPCHKPDRDDLERLDGKPQCPCAKREFPSEEEIQRQLAVHEKHKQMFMATLPLIARIKKEHAGHNWKGIEECPVCKGKLHMSCAGSYNGHVWGQCETKGCLSWME